MDNEKLSHFKTLLEEERERVEGELREIGVLDPATDIWEATPGDIDESATEEDELADRIEDLEENQSEVGEMQKHWRNINRAIEKIDDGTYGICEISGEPIEEDRLEANPSARTCKVHMEQEGELTE